MEIKFKLTQAASSNGTVPHNELLARLRGGVGESLYVSETGTDSFRQAKSKPDFDAKMATAEVIMCMDGDILRALAN